MMHAKKIVGISVLLLSTAVVLPSVQAEESNGKQEMKQGIKEDRKTMNQGIKDDRMKMQEENRDRRSMMGSGMMMGTGTMWGSGMMNRPMMGSGMMSHSGAEMSEFLKSPLSTEDQAAIKAIHDKHRATMESLMKDTTLTPEQRLLKMQEDATLLMNDMLPYIALDQVEAFKKMSADRVAMMGKMQDVKRENTENRENFREGAKETRKQFQTQVADKKKVLSDKLNNQLTAALNKLPLERIQMVLANVDRAVVRIAASTASTQKDRILAQLQEIKSIVQEKIDELSGGSSDSSLIEEVLTGTASGSTN